MPRRGNDVVVIYWRDIPAQVNGQAGRDRHQVALSEKFQRAIDRAKRKAKIYTAQEDVAQWRRVSEACAGDVEVAAKERADRIEADYSAERLGALAFVGGWESDLGAASPGSGSARAEVADRDDPRPDVGGRGGEELT